MENEKGQYVQIDSTNKAVFERTTNAIVEGKLDLALPGIEQAAITYTEQ